MDPAKERTARAESMIAPRPIAGAATDPRLAARVWYVWAEGGEPVGPVSADQIARGIRAGRVPSDASLRHESETFWSDMLDQPDVVAALKAVSEETQPPHADLFVPRYLVWIEGGDPVGPVSADQIARGIRAGKVPSDASLQRVDELFASDLLDEPDVIEALKRL